MTTIINNNLKLNTGYVEMTHNNEDIQVNLITKQIKTRKVIILYNSYLPISRMLSFYEYRALVKNRGRYQRLKIKVDNR